METERSTNSSHPEKGAFCALFLAKPLAKLIGGHLLDRQTHSDEDDVREAINAYLRGDIGVEQLDERLTLFSWDNAEAPELAYEAELLIAEARKGDRPDLPERLADLVAPAPAAALVP